MLAAMGLAAVAVQGQQSIENGCAIAAAPWRHVNDAGGTSRTICCPAEDSTPSNCYMSDNVCDVANAIHLCCGLETNDYTLCASFGTAECNDVRTVNPSWEMCPPPAPPVPPSPLPLRGKTGELSSGAIGGIVVGAYLGVAGAFGAWPIIMGRVYRGVAAGV